MLVLSTSIYSNVNSHRNHYPCDTNVVELLAKSNIRNVMAKPSLRPSPKSRDGVSKQNGELAHEVNSFVNGGLTLFWK